MNNQINSVTEIIGNEELNENLEKYWEELAGDLSKEEDGILKDIEKLFISK